jgi:hypothetical protein
MSLNPTTPSLLDQDLTFQHLLANGISHCRLEMTDHQENHVTTDINESYDR